MSANVILYELNEVPWAVIDRYIELRPDSHVAALLAAGQSLTTRVEDSHSLQPWRTWPTFHKSMTTEEHNSIHLGQDPRTFRGDNIWDAVEGAGLRVGLFGPLQSWPARPFAHGGFYVPDTFSRDSKAYPTSMSQFQAFNLALTRDNAFSSDAKLSAGMIAKVGIDLIHRGLVPSSAAVIGGQLVRETIDHRYKARRSIIQVLPSFDLYWKLHRRYRPHLSVFFTNHVASMMHRFWGDGMPGYAEEHEYSPDTVFGKFIMDAMAIVDHQLGRVGRYIDRNSDTVLVVAASMGQQPVLAEDEMSHTFVLDDAERLISRLHLDGARRGLAMYPRIILEFPGPEGPSGAVDALESIRASDNEAVFANFETSGRTVSFDIRYGSHSAALEGPLTFTPRCGYEASTVGRCEELGITSRKRIGGGNTGYHVPDGMLLAYGPRISKDGSRRQVNVLNVTPSLLENVMGVAPASSMRGEASLFN